MKSFLIHKFTLFTGAAVMSAAGTAAAQETPSSGVNAAGQTAMEGGTVLTTGAEGLSGALTDFGERQQEIGETTAAELQAFLESQGDGGGGDEPAGPEALTGELEGLGEGGGEPPAGPEEAAAELQGELEGGGDDESPAGPEEAAAELQGEPEDGEGDNGDGGQEPPAPEELAGEFEGNGDDGDSSGPDGLFAQGTVDVQPDGQATVTAGVEGFGETEVAFPPEDGVDEGGDEEAPAAPGEDGDGEAPSDPEAVASELEAELTGEGDGEGEMPAPSDPEAAAAELEEAVASDGESPEDGEDSGDGAEPPPEFAASGEATGSAVDGGSGALAGALSGFQSALRTGFDGIAEALIGIVPALGAAFDQGAAGDPEGGIDSGAQAFQAGAEQGGDALAAAGEQGQAAGEAGAADGESVVTEFAADMQAAFGADGGGDSEPPELPGEGGNGEQPAPPEGGNGGGEPPFAVAPGVTILANAGQATADNVSENLIGQGGDALILMVEDGGAVLGEGIANVSAGLAEDAGAFPPEGGGDGSSPPEDGGDAPVGPEQVESELQGMAEGDAGAPEAPEGAGDAPAGPGQVESELQGMAEGDVAAPDGADAPAPPQG